MKKQIINKVQTLIILIIYINFIGCTSSAYKQFYIQEAPKKYPITKKVLIFKYDNANLYDIQKILFNNYLVIGESSFIGPYESPTKVISFAKSIGTDILLINVHLKEIRNTIITSSYGTQMIITPISIHRYKQNAIFLKNINNITPLWNRTIKQYKKTKVNKLEGIWENESYRIKIFQSGKYLVAFIVYLKDGNKSYNKKFWKKDDLKFIFEINSKKGVYLMGNKTPIPAIFEINKFGYLEIKLLINDIKFSFEKVK